MRAIVEFGTRLREERDRLGLNQDELAARLGISKTSQSNYERGNRSPDADYLVAFVAAGADPLYLLRGVRSPEPRLSDVPPPIDQKPPLAWQGQADLLEQLGQLLAQVPGDQREAAAMALSGWAKAGGADTWRRMFAAAIEPSEKQRRTGT